MNSAFYIIFVPMLLVMLGYMVVFRSMGLSLGYPRLVIAVLLFAGALYWLGRRVVRKTNSGGH
jgi:membrane protein DedA with SNARE-associated domain